MPNNNYTINKLNDFTRLDEISLLVHDTFIESGLIAPDSTKKADFYSHLNKIKETTILIAECNGQIIGTNSMTIDSPAGLHTDKYFKEETDLIRKKKVGILGSSWRIATNHEYRKDIHLFLDLIQNSFYLAKEMNIETCLFVFNKKHETFYRELLDAKTIAEKMCTIDHIKYVPFVLMQTNTKKSQKCLNKIFTRRKFY